MPKIQPDDWVRFWVDGKLVIGKVEYVVRDLGWPDYGKAGRRVHTSNGWTKEDDVLEVRRPAPSKPLDTDHVFDRIQQ